MQTFEIPMDDVPGQGFNKFPEPPEPRPKRPFGPKPIERRPGRRPLA